MCLGRQLSIKGVDKCTYKIHIAFIIISHSERYRHQDKAHGVSAKLPKWKRRRCSSSIVLLPLRLILYESPSTFSLLKPTMIHRIDTCVCNSFEWDGIHIDENIPSCWGITILWKRSVKIVDQYSYFLYPSLSVLFFPESVSNLVWCRWLMLRNYFCVGPWE